MTTKLPVKVTIEGDGKVFRWMMMPIELNTIEKFLDFTGYDSYISIEIESKYKDFETLENDIGYNL